MCESLPPLCQGRLLLLQVPSFYVLFAELFAELSEEPLGQFLRAL